MNISTEEFEVKCPHCGHKMMVVLEFRVHPKMHTCTECNEAFLTKVEDVIMDGYVDLTVHVYILQFNYTVDYSNGVGSIR